MVYRSSESPIMQISSRLLIEKLDQHHIIAVYQLLVIQITQNSFKFRAVFNGN